MKWERAKGDGKERGREREGGGDGDEWVGGWGCEVGRGER